MRDHTLYFGFTVHKYAMNILIDAHALTAVHIIIRF